MKKELLKNNKAINWIPDHIQEGRFGKWLEGARDWAISRNRYWGTPLPLWRSECGEIKCFGSRKELEEVAKRKVDDLHKHKIDDIVFNCKCGKVVDITYVRHGETADNAKGIIQGARGDSAGNQLNATGKKQAEKAAEQLSKEKFDLIICSPLGRAKETAEIINKKLKVEIVIEDGLRERNFGEWDGKKLFEDLKLDVEAVRRKNPPKGETLFTVAARHKAVYNRYFGKKVLVVGHSHAKLASLMLCENLSIEAIVHAENEHAKPCPMKYKDLMRRVPEVLDCWFESGSMPYAQLHYPFENKEKFENNFPAAFIAEGLDQTRGWFYTLHVLASALFKKPAFKNCIVNGIVLAEDGQKMSKRLKNYPAPDEVMEKHGADAMRFYLMNSPVVKADDMRFSEKGVSDVVRNFILPIWNSYSFFVTYANIDNWKPKSGGKNATPKNKLDQWILAELNKLIVQETEHMEAYDLQKASNEIYQFVDSLTNWYIRRSRRRFWKSEDDSDKLAAYETLYTVLTKLCQIIAPFCPFLSEEIYKNLTGEESVHLSEYPTAGEIGQSHLLEEMFMAKTIVSLGLASRAKLKIKVRQPLQKIQIALGDQYDKALLNDQLDTIKEELNVKEVEFIAKPGDLATVIAKPNAKLLGPKYGKEVQNIIQEAKAGRFERLGNGNLKVLAYELEPAELEIAYLGKEGRDIETEAGILIALDFSVTPELEMEGQARDIVRNIQELRKEAGYNVNDRIQVALIGVNPELIKQFGDYIKAETLATSIEKDIEGADTFAENEGITFKLKR